MIDVGALCLGPSMATFARPITVTPVASDPGAPAYVGAEGIWDSRPVDIETEAGGLLSGQTHTLGIQAAAFVARGFPVPAQFDLVEIDAYMSLPRIGVCEISDVDDDGQGGLTLTLKILSP